MKIDGIIHIPLSPDWVVLKLENDTSQPDGAKISNASFLIRITSLPKANPFASSDECRDVESPAYTTGFASAIEFDLQTTA